MSGTQPVVNLRVNYSHLLAKHPLADARSPVAAKVSEGCNPTLV